MQTCHISARRHTCTYCTHRQVWLLRAKSTYGPIIWSLKVFGFIFNSAGERVCQPLDCLNHIIPPLCILMNVHQAKRCVHVCVRGGMSACTIVRACVPGVGSVLLLVCVLGHTSVRRLVRLESSLCLAAGHKNNL